MAGRPLNEKEKTYLLDIIRQEDHVEEYLRKCGYHDPEPRNQLLRHTGNIAESGRSGAKEHTGYSFGLHHHFKA